MISDPASPGAPALAARPDRGSPLPPALDAPWRTLVPRGVGALRCYRDDGPTDACHGPPLVLLHSINAGASAYEVRPLFERYRRRRAVVAPDLPGFGGSDRAARAYTPALYAAAITAVLDDAARGRGPVDVVALSLTSEFAARVAADRPDLVRSLALLSPSGFTAPREGRAPDPRDRESRGRAPGTVGGSVRVYRVLTVRLWAQALYAVVASRRSVRFFLRKFFVGPIDAGLADYAYRTAHRPGARHAPLTFLSGRLRTVGVRAAVYHRVATPVLVLYDADPFARFEHLPDTLVRHANWRAVRIAPTRGLPHWERPDDVARALEAFWADPPRPTAAGTVT